MRNFLIIAAVLGCMRVCAQPGNDTTATDSLAPAIVDSTIQHLADTLNARQADAIVGQAPDSTVETDDRFFRDFTVSSANEHSTLVWKTGPPPGEGYFVVERSLDGTRFETTSVITASLHDSAYNVGDDPGVDGNVYYRIKFAPRNGAILYTKAVQTNTIPFGNLRFYPNPVDKLLVIRSSHELAVQITDGYGTVLISQDVVGGMQVVNMAGLPKGTYLLKAMDKQTNGTTTEQLIKN